MFIGDNPGAADDLFWATEYGFPVVVLEGSESSAAILKAKGKGSETGNKQLMEFAKTGKFYVCKESSEDVASIVHLLLTVTLEPE